MISFSVLRATKTAVFLSKTAVFFGPMAKFRRCRRSCVVICLRISYNHAMERETGRATGGRLLSGTDQRHRFPVRISGRRYAGGGHAAVRLAAFCKIRIIRFGYLLIRDCVNVILISLLLRIIPLMTVCHTGNRYIRENLPA